MGQYRVTRGLEVKKTWKSQHDLLRYHAWTERGRVWIQPDDSDEGPFSLMMRDAVSLARWILANKELPRR